MNDVQLEYFCTLAKTMHLGKASEQLFVSPPSLSTTIKRIEAELGVPLFQRCGRNIELTEYGKYFLPKAEGMLKLYNEAKVDLLNLKNAELNRIVIGGISLASEPSLLSEIIKSNTNISFDKSSFITDDMAVSALNSPNLDIYISSRSINSNALEKHWLYSEPQYLVCSKYNPLADKKRITKEEIEKCRFAAGTKDTTQRWWFDIFCKDLNFKPKLGILAGSTSVLINMALADPSLVVLITQGVCNKEVKGSTELTVLDTDFAISDISVYAYRSKDKTINPNANKTWEKIINYYSSKEENHDRTN